MDSCLFCGKQDARFKEGDNLDLHFCEQCPMLASCSNCGQIVEISSLKDHYLFECASGKRYESYNSRLVVVGIVVPGDTVFFLAL